MKANRSKTYLIPLLLREISFDTSYFPHIYNTYISDSKDEYKDCIFIEFVGDDIENYREFKESLRENSSCVNIIANEKKDIFVFKFPKKYLDEYNWFKQSKYSRYGVDAKVYITSFWKDYAISPGMKHFYKKLKGILYKEKSFKQELEDSLNVVIPNEIELGEKIELVDETVELKQ